MHRLWGRGMFEDMAPGTGPLVGLVLGLAALMVLFLLVPPLYFIQGLSNYLPLHMALETASILVAFLIFGVVWNAYSRERAGNVVILAIGLMAAGLIDFAHMLSYKGMPVFVTPGSPEKAINFWLAARLLTAATFLVAALRPWRPLEHPGSRHYLLLAALALAGLVWWAGLWHEAAWPRTFIEGEGLTTFKIGTEYLISALFVGATVFFVRNARRTAIPGGGALAAAAAVSALGEWCFTFYADVTDTFNLLGHLYKVVAFVLVYRSVFVASVREPFERLHAEEAALAESEQRLHSIFQAAQDGILVADLETQHFLAANPAVCAMLQYDADEILRLGVSDIHPPAELGYVQEQFRRQARGEIAVALDIPVRRKDGTVFYADINSAPITLGGRPALLGLVRDVTERRELELALQASEERLALALRGAQDGLWDWDLLTNAVFYSPRWKALLGYADAEIPNVFEEWQARVHPDDVGGALEAVRAHIDGRSDHLEMEFRMRHKDGHWVWLLGRGAVVRDAAGKPVRMVGTHVDISAIKAAQQREAEMAAMLRERLKEINCLYRVTALNADIKHPVGELLKQVVAMLPLAWQYPEVAGARIELDGTEYVTPHFTASHWQQREALTVSGVARGSVTVCYREECPPADEGPFLQEERQLLTAVAHQLGRMIALHENHATLQRVNRILTTLSASNRSLVRARSEQELAQSLCQILVGEGGYARAWIGLAEADGRRLRRLAGALAPGMAAPDPAFLPLDTDSLAARAFAHNQRQLAHNMPGERCAVCAGDDLKHACAAAIVLPLCVDHTPVGVLVVCSAEHLEVGAREEQLFEELASDLSYGISTLRTRGERDQALSDLEATLFQTIAAIGRTVEKRDPYTAGHQQRVAELAVAIAREMGMSEAVTTGIRLGSVIHDIGKIYIPAEILSRPGRLNEAEFALIKSHPAVGYDIVRDVRFPWPVREMIRQHHERLDGSGYPDGLAGDDILLEARIIAVADVVEAVTAHRPYRPGLGIDKALEVLRAGRGSQFDAAAVDCCLRLFAEKRFQWEAHPLQS